MPEAQRRLLRRTWLRRTLPAGAVAVLVVAGTAVVRTNANATPVDTYRTTTVSTGSVEQRLNLTGSVQRVNQVSQSFAVAGTISSVLVSVGDSVKVGQALATLDSRPLRSAVTAARADLAQAKATLESDQSAATTATPTVVTPTPTPSSPVAAPSGRSGAGANQNLARAKNRVATAQSTVAADLGRASAALAKCAPFFPTEAPQTHPTTPAPTTPPPTTPPPTTPPPTTPAPTTPPPTTSPAAATTARPSTTTTAPSQADIRACIGALRTAPTQQKIQRDLQSLTRSQADLFTAFTTVITTTANTATAPATTTRSGSTRQSTTGQSTTSQSTSSQSTSSQSTGSRTGSTTGQSSADRVVSDQAAVTSAEAALSSAQADLTASTLKSPITGTVGSVSLAKNTSSNGKNIVIVGAGAVEVTINVPLASMANVHVGQKANVTPQGATSIAAGSVTSISLLPSTSSSSTGTGSGTGQGASTTSSPTYPVVVLVPDALPALATGSRADVSLLIGTVSKVLTVPNSALTPLAKGQAMAVTLKNGVATPALVKTGYAGTLTTQVTAGLTAGQQVVLADLSTALPTNTTSSRRFGVAGGSAGGLGGAGFGGGSLTGGPGFPPPG